MNANRLYEATQHEIIQIVTDDILPDNMTESSGKAGQKVFIQLKIIENDFKSKKNIYKVGVFPHGHGRNCNISEQTAIRLFGISTKTEKFSLEHSRSGFF